MTGWRKSSHCVENNCVWVDIRADVVFVRGYDEQGSDRRLVFLHHEWAAFLAGVKAGEFDLPEVTP